MPAQSLPLQAEIWAQIPIVAQEPLLSLWDHLRALEWENRRLHADNREKSIAQCPTCRDLCLEFEDLRKENIGLQGVVKDLQAQLDAAKERVNQNSSNSSRPPSSDLPGTKRYPKKRLRSGKKRGAQPNHPGRYRKLYNEDEADITVINHEPVECSACGNNTWCEEVGSPQVHQVGDPPKPSLLKVDEHRLHARRCAKCRKVTRANLPSGVTRRNFGPRASAMVCMMTGCYSLGRRPAAALMRDITGIKISVGSVSSLEKEMTEALKQPVAEAKESVKQSPRVNNDATGWYNNGKRQYAFISVTPDVVTYDITSQHNADVVMQILGPTWPGRVITSDRHTIYSVIPPEHRQICNSHTDRDFHKMADRGGASKSIGEQGTAIEQRMFHEWHRFKAGEINRDQLEKEFAPIEADLKKLLTEGIACCQQQHNKKDVCTHHKTNRTSKNMLELLPAFCTFAHQEGVEPTNNLAEQAARILVIKRKLSFGSKSEDGNRYIEAMMTTAATLAKQGRHLLTFLVAAVTALLTGGQAPSLLRPPSSSEQAWELQPPPSGTDPMPKAFEVLVEDSRPPPLETAIRIKKAAA